jgi:hypothetical protein
MHLRPTLLMAVPACAAALAGCGGAATSSSSSSAASASASTSGAASGTGSASGATGPQIGFEGVPLEQGPSLAPASTTGTSTVDGISCGSQEQLAYHIHAHLAVFDSGRLYALPGGVGIPGSRMVQTPQGPVANGGSCIYWLHTHTNDGIIHVESPTKAIYTLGDFFDEWHQPLGRARVASLHGTVTAFVNGHRWRGGPRSIRLLPHEDIQLDIGQPAPPIEQVNWSQTQL